jgi:hypothetical protein
MASFPISGLLVPVANTRQRATVAGAQQIANMDVALLRVYEI